MVKEQERDFYRRWKRRLAYVRTLPYAAGAKPKGANTTAEITYSNSRTKIYNFFYYL